jgi:[acyl-carrier-protein] S-malonyltransferase
MAEAARTAYIFPGQGAQYVGMGRDLYDEFSSARAVFKQVDEALGFPLSKLCFEGPDEELRQTINAQPAIVTMSFALLAALREAKGSNTLPQPAFVAGHSLGEYTALAAAGVVDFATAVRLTRERGRLMHQAGLEQPGGMAAIIGLDEPVLANICARCGTRIANINCPGQLVISGDRDKLAQARQLAEASGARLVIPLQVSGAFHTAAMQPAAEGLVEVLANISLAAPLVPIVANTTAREVTTAAAVKGELLNQLCNSVQWQRSVEYMIGNGVTTFVEIGPGKVLTGLVKRINRDVKTLNIGDAEAVRNTSFD